MWPKASKVGEVESWGGFLYIANFKGEAYPWDPLRSATVFGIGSEEQGILPTGAKYIRVPLLV